MPVSSYRRDLPELIRSSDETYSRGLAAISRSSRIRDYDRTTNDDQSTSLESLRYSLRYKSRSFTSASLGLSRRTDDVSAATRTRRESAGSGATSTRTSTSSPSPTGSPSSSRAAATTKAVDSTGSRTSNGVSSSRKSSPAPLVSRDSSLSHGEKKKLENERVGSLISSPKWSRIKETFEGDNFVGVGVGGGVESRSDDRSKLRRNHSQSTSSLPQMSLSPKRRNPIDPTNPPNREQVAFSRVPTYRHSTNIRLNASKRAPEVERTIDFKTKTSDSKRVSSRLPNLSTTELHRSDRKSTDSESKNGFSRNTTETDNYCSKTSKDSSRPLDSDDEDCSYGRISNKTDISKARKTTETNISPPEKKQPDSFEEKVKALRRRIASTARDYDSVIKDNERVVEKNKASLTRSCSLRYDSDRDSNTDDDRKKKTPVSYSSEYEIPTETNKFHDDHEENSSVKLYSRFDRIDRIDRTTIRNSSRDSDRLEPGENSSQLNRDQNRETRKKSTEISTREKSSSRFDRDQTRDSTRKSLHTIEQLEHRDQSRESKRKSIRNLSEQRHEETILRKTPEKSYSRYDEDLDQIETDQRTSCSNETIRDSVFLADNENDVIERVSCRSEFGDLSTRRSLPKTLDLVNGSTAWKKSNTGSWMKVEHKPEVATNCNVSSAQSRVALLAQQFNHLGTGKNASTSSTTEKFTRSISVPLRTNPNSKTTGKKSDLKYDLSPPKYQTTRVFKERCLSLPSSRESSVNSLKNSSSPNESSMDEDGLKQALNAGRKLSLVKQVVQSFEEQTSASNSSESSSSSRENTPTTSNGRGKNGNFNKNDSKANSEVSKTANGTSEANANNEDKKLKTRQRNPKNVPTMVKKQRPDLPPPRKPSTPRRPLYVNAPRTEDSLLAELEEWLVQKYDSKDNGKSSMVKAVPNQSFLWKDLGPELSNGACPKMDGGEQQATGNYYSLPFAHPNSPIKTNQEDHIYMEASFVKPPRSDSNDAKIADNASSCDSDEGWVDISDTELEGGGDPSSPRVRVRTKSISSQAGSGSRKSWRDSVRELAAAGPRCILDDETWNHKDYQDIVIWESVEGDDSSLSSTSDHFYEALYEEIVDNGRENATDVKRTNSFGLKSIVESPVDNNDALPHPAPPNQGPKYDNVSGLKKRNSFAETSVTSPVEEASQLKRNWSLTKKDIHLELDAKLSKNKPSKSAGNLTDITPTTTTTNVKPVTSPGNTRASKRKTLIKFILRQKKANAVPATTLPVNPGPNTTTKKTRTRKKGSMFYVRWSTVNRDTRQKSQSENDIAAGETNSEVDSGNGTSSERLDSNTSPTHGAATIKRRPSDIRRPSSPPPLPPVASSTVVRSREGTKSLEILRPSLSRMPFDEKTKSLDSVVSVAAAGTSDESNREVDATGKSDQQLIRNGTNSERSSCSSTGTRASSSSSSRVPADSPFSLSPKCRSSVASSHSSHSGAGSYMNVEDLASKPKSLALPLTNDSDSLCSYLLISADLKEPLKSPFEEEPLYQFYHKDAKQRATLWQSMSTMEEDEQMYREEYSDDFSDTESEEDKLKDDDRRPESPDDENECPKSPGLSTLKTLYPPSRGGIPSAMELLRQEGGGGQRTLWCEVPEVRNSGILDKISPQDRKIQEAMFEVITSEASYLKSLNILMEHFTQCPEFSEDFSVNCVLGRRERHILFSDVAPVRDVSARLLTDLERRWQENIVLTNICDILYEHASKFFSVYVKYCANQVYQDRILKELKATRPDFIEVLRRLESNPICQGLDMLSFLMLPMQRITRMPLLLDAIYHRLSPESPYHGICKLTLATLNKVVAECNEGARRMERMEEMLVISRQLDFRDCKSIPLISASRWLVKKGELTRVSFDSSNVKRTFGRTNKFAKSPVYFFLFTDLLVVGKKKNEESYVVLDYCPRNMVQVFTLEESNVQIPEKLPEGLRNSFQLTMLQNNEFKTVEMILSCPLESDRTRWMEAVTPPISENPDEKIYEEWDCPQVQCVYPYFAQQPDELSLEESDVVNVLRKMPDGWYEGERLRDGQRGWFPASFSVEIISSHIRARNLRQRYRLLMLSQAYVEEQRKAFVNRVKSK